MGDITSIIAKIRGLRALSTSSNVHEAAAAAATADRLIQEHRLEEAALEVGGRSPDAPGLDPEPLFAWPGARVGWERYLANSLGEHYDVAIVYQKLVKGCQAVMCGRPGDVAVLREMYAWCHSEIASMASAHRYRGRRRSAFCLGAADGVRLQLACSKRAAQAAASAATAIVLADRITQVEAALALAIPGLKSATCRPTCSDEAAFHSGRHAGQSLDVSPNRTRRFA